MTVEQCKEREDERSDAWEDTLNSLLASTGACLGARVGSLAVGGTSAYVCGMFELSCIEQRKRLRRRISPKDDET